MTRHLVGKLGVGAVACAVFLVLGIAKVSLSQAQSASDDWEKAAGGKMSFDVASVKQNTSGHGAGSDLPFGGDTQPIKGSLFTATSMPVSFYISVAYKLNITESRSLDSQMPKWAREERFDVQGNIPPETTKDQVRLMLQSLLADRFYLKVHFETRETPVYAAVLAKSGVTGPNLKAHAENPPCPDASRAVSVTPDESTWGLPTACGGVIAAASSYTFYYAARKVSMRTIAENLPLTPNNGLDRPVVDQTGLAGDFDLVLKYTAQARDGGRVQAEDYQAAFLEALKDQLGLKLRATTAPFDTLVIDRIEEPSPN